MTTILIVEDHPMVVDWTRQRLFEILPDASVDDAGSIDEALSFVSANGAPDWILLDLGLPDATELEALRRFRLALPRSRIVVLSGVADPDLQRRVMAEGAFAFLHKTHDVDTMSSHLRSVLLAKVRVYPLTVQRGSDPDSWLLLLTPSERKVLLKLSKGAKTNKQIGRELKLAEATIKKLSISLYRKAGLGNDVRNKRIAVIERFKTET